jgi:subtilisin family serine protease
LAAAGIAALAVTGVGLTTGAAAAAPPAGGPVDTYIVTLDPATAPAKGAERAARLGGRITHVYGALSGFAVNLPAALADRLKTLPGVVDVEADQNLQVNTTESAASWGLDRIDQPAPALDNSYTYKATGAGVTAYIIDTGIQFGNSDFGGRAKPGYDAVGGDAGDCNGHGTHVAGTVGGARYGVAKGVDLVAVRVLDCNGSGTTSGVIAGINWVTANHAKAAVANMSLGGGASTALDNAVAQSVAGGVTYAVAAGNGNSFGIPQNACNSSPARVPAALTVGATDRTDKPASFSNYGSCVDLFAPGVGITSDWYDKNATTGPSTATSTISGTSMATPHVTGVAALFLQGNPTATPATVSSAIKAATMKHAVPTTRTANNNLLFTNY